MIAKLYVDQDTFVKLGQCTLPQIIASMRGTDFYCVEIFVDLDEYVVTSSNAPVVILKKLTKCSTGPR